MKLRKNKKQTNKQKNKTKQQHMVWRRVWRQERLRAHLSHFLIKPGNSDKKQKTSGSLMVYTVKTKI